MNQSKAVNLLSNLLILLLKITKDQIFFPQLYLDK